MMHEFVTMQARTTRPDPNKPDRQITDFEEVLINLDHVQFVSKGMTDDTCMIAFPGNQRQMVKGSLDQVMTMIEKATAPKTIVRALRNGPE